MIKLTYATGNKAKIESAKLIFEPMGIEVESVKLDDLLEIQADTHEEVAIYSSKLAYEKLGKMVLKNDGGLIIPKLNNFPGVYTHYVEDTITEEGILKLLSGYDSDEDRYAYFVECLALTEDDGNTKVFKCITEGKIAKEASGEFGWGLDKIFIPKGEEVTLANFEDEKRYAFWGQEGYYELGKYLVEKYK
ncbi:MAG: non-canonical purine NTP pyrophosphatase [Clostridia bacterium]|nr:non-canonical purine NTP pyrophosphatase [Clostridia bacterium]